MYSIYKVPHPKSGFIFDDSSFQKIAKIENNQRFTQKIIDSIRQNYQHKKLQKTLYIDEIIYPRKAYYQRTMPTNLTEVQLGFICASQSYRALLYSMKVSPKICRQLITWNGIRANIDSYRGYPLRIKLSRAFKVDTVDSIKPHYIKEISYYCALAQKSRGKILLFYPSTRVEEFSHESPLLSKKLVPSFKTFDVTFSDIEKIQEKILLVKEQLLSALEIKNPYELTYCPEWMCTSCPYIDECKRAERVAMAI